VCNAFRRACEERDWLVAEFLLQTIEAIAKRRGDDLRLDDALMDFAQQLPRQRQ